MADKMIKQMGADTGAGEVASIDTGWPPKAAPRSMQKQMGEDPGDIKALLSGGHYDPSTVTGEGEGLDITPDEASMYQGNKKPRVPGGTFGFGGVPKRNEPVEPYPEIDSDIYGREPLGAGFQPKHVFPVLETPGNSKIVGDMGTGMPVDKEFAGPAKIGPGDMVSDYEAGEQSDPGAEDTFAANLVGDMVAGAPTDHYPAGEKISSEVAPDGLVTGRVKGAYAPNVNKPTVVPPAGTRPSNDRGVAGSSDIKAEE